MIILQVVQNAVDTVQQVSQVSVQGYEKLPYWELAKMGGVIVILLAILLLIAIYIFFERYFAIRKSAKENPSFMTNLKNYILEGKIDSAIALCQSTETPLSRMLEKGLSRLGRPLSDISETIENAGKLEIAKLEKGITFLATIGSLAPSIGFLGTVTGMVRAFFNMANAGNNIDISLLSQGIYEALITTVAGLIVGIIVTFLYNIIVDRIERLVYMLEARATEFIDFLQQPQNKNYGFETQTQNRHRYE